MKTLDDAWNARDWEVFRKRHSADTSVHWPGQPDPTRGREAHQVESEAFFKSIENRLENNPYKVMFASAIGPARLPSGRARWSALGRGWMARFIPRRGRPSSWSSARLPDGKAARS